MPVAPRLLATSLVNNGTSRNNPRVVAYCLCNNATSQNTAIFTIREANYLCFFFCNSVTLRSETFFMKKVSILLMSYVEFSLYLRNEKRIFIGNI